MTRRSRIVVALGALIAIGLVYWQFYLPSRYLRRAEVSIAVVPFDGADPAVARQFNELLVAELAKLPGVQVTSPSTVRRYQRLGISPAFMARILGLRVILEGTIAHGAITARVADVHSGRMIGADTIEAEGGPGLGEAKAIAGLLVAHLRVAKRK